MLCTALTRAPTAPAWSAKQPISVKRLDAVPWARYCVTCQEQIANRIASGEMVEFQEADR